MKNLSNITAYFPALVPLAIAVCLPTTTLLGQAKEPSKAAPNSASKEPRIISPEELQTMRVSLEFRDAQLEEVAEYLSRKFEGANIVVPARVAPLRVTVALRNVTLDQALDAIAFALQNQITVAHLNENVYGFAPTDVALTGAGPAPDRPACRIFALGLAPHFASADEGNAQTKMIVELKESLDKAIGLLKRVDPTSSVDSPSLEFHPTTKLLIAVGKPEELGIVEQLVTALGGRKAEIPPATGTASPGVQVPGPRRSGR